MIITDQARDVLKNILVTHSNDPEMGVRLVFQPQDRRFALLLAYEQPGDQLIEQEGLKILMVAPDLAPTVDNMTIDIENTESGPALVMNKIDGSKN